MTTTVQYTMPINIVQDNAETIATKKQLAKRQAFALLNTELEDDATYVIRTSGTWKANKPDLDQDGKPVITGDGVFTYRITAVQWSEQR